MALVEDLCASLAAIGFRKIVFLNGHYDNTYAIAYACATAQARLPEGVEAYPVNYWDGMTADEAAEFFDPSNGLHANRGETSAVLAIDPGLVDMDRANEEMPPFRRSRTPPPVHTAFFFSNPGSGLYAPKAARGATRAGRRPSSGSGTWPSSPMRPYACLTTSTAPSRAMPPPPMQGDGRPGSASQEAPGVTSLAVKGDARRCPRRIRGHLFRRVRRPGSAARPRSRSWKPAPPWLALADGRPELDRSPGAYGSVPAAGRRSRGRGRGPGGGRGATRQAHAD